VPAEVLEYLLYLMITEYLVSIIVGRISVSTSDLGVISTSLRSKAKIPSMGPIKPQNTETRRLRYESLFNQNGVTLYTVFNFRDTDGIETFITV
jgi:hypothetical protein